MERERKKRKETQRLRLRRGGERKAEKCDIVCREKQRQMMGLRQTREKA